MNKNILVNVQLLYQSTVLQLITYVYILKKIHIEIQCFKDVCKTYLRTYYME